MLEIKGLKKKYGKFQAVDNLNMQIESGALYGFIGPNGAGKTTTIRVILGLTRPDEGSVTLDGMNMLSGAAELKNKIGYVPDYFGIYDNLKVSEYMEFFAACYHMEGLTARKRCDALLGQVELDDKRDFYVDSLSRGMKQKLCLARALIHDPELLIMDEPTSGLDPRTRFEFKEILKELKEQGKTILISSHILSELSQVCTDIGIIDQGKMVLNGSISDILSRVNVSNPLMIGIQGNMDQAIQILRAEQNVRTISIRDAEIEVNFTGNQEQEAELLKKLVSAGVSVRSFIREPGSLESIFMQITGKEDEMEVLSYEN